MIHWSNPLKWFQIDPDAPVERRRVFAMGKAQLEALRYIAEALDDFCNMGTMGPGAVLEWAYLLERPGDETDTAPARVEALREIAIQLSRLRLGKAMGDDFAERDVANLQRRLDAKSTTPIESDEDDPLTGEPVKLGAMLELNKPLYEPGRYRGLPAPADSMRGFLELALGEMTDAVAAKAAKLLRKSLEEIRPQLRSKNRKSRKK